MSLFFRPNTWDQDIWNSIVTHNEYGIKNDWRGYVIDVGGHIGSFSYFMLTQKQTTKCIVIEPDPENFSVLQHNLGSFIAKNKVIAFNTGIGPKNTSLSFVKHVPVNTGGMSYSISPNGNIPSTTLDDLINLVPQNINILLKLDCEGCEYSALENCTQLNRINCIVGEYHSRSNNQNQFYLKDLLEKNNFVFAYHTTSSGLGMFGAHQKY